jgi:hypothetical protein
MTYHLTPTCVIGFDKAYFFLSAQALLLKRMAFYSWIQSRPDLLLQAFLDDTGWPRNFGFDTRGDE